MVSLTIAHSHAVAHTLSLHLLSFPPIVLLLDVPLIGRLVLSYCSSESQYFELSRHTILKPSFHRSLTSALFPPAEVSITLPLSLLLV